MSNNSLLILVGPSGSGKSTLARYLAEKHGFKVVPSVTTRPHRKDDDSSMLFVTPNEFRRLIDAKAFAEWEQFNDHYYGTTRKILVSGHGQRVKVARPEGAFALAYFANRANIDVSIAYIGVDEDVLRQRLIDRDGDDSFRARGIAAEVKEVENAVYHLKRRDPNDAVVVKLLDGTLSLEQQTILLMTEELSQYHH